jgi:hypothetical protein
MSDTPSATFRGIRSFVPWRKQTILKWAFPSLVIGDSTLTIMSGKNSWGVTSAELGGIVVDPKALLIKKVDGTAGRFKASKNTIAAILPILDSRGIQYTRTEGSTYWMVSGRPDNL